MFTRLPWYVAGPLIGLIILALRVTLNRPFGTLGGYIEISDSIQRKRAPGFTSLFLAGIVLGAAAYATFTGTFAISFGYGVNDLVSPTGLTQVGLLAVAGVAMGLGARTAGGCTSGHGLCGTSLGSGASIAATTTFFGTAVLLAHAIEWLT